jgi:hypothetical protein
MVVETDVPSGVATPAPATPAPEGGKTDRGAVDAGGNEPWISEASPAWRAARQAPWRLAISVEPALGFPFGDYYDGTKSNAGFEGTIHIALSPEVALRANVALLGMEFSDEMNLISLDPSVQIVSQEYDVDAVRYSAGLEYHQPLGRADSGTSFWFVHTSAGAIRHAIKGTLTVRTMEGETARLEAEDVTTKFTLTSGAGLLFGLSRHLGFQLGGDVDGVWTEVYYPEGTSSVGVRGWVVSVHAGLAVVL